MSKEAGWYSACFFSASDRVLLDHAAFPSWEFHTIRSADWNDNTRLEQYATVARTPLPRWNVGTRFTLRALSGGESGRVHVVTSVPLNQHASSHAVAQPLGCGFS